MLFQNKLKEFYNEVQQSFGTRKHDDCFTVDVDFKDENFIIKSIVFYELCEQGQQCKTYKQLHIYICHISVNQLIHC